MDSQNEKKLIASYLKDNNKEALDSLIKIYLKPVFNFILYTVGSNKDAEDLTQETFLKMWKNLKKYKQSRDFKPWLYQIAKNTCFDYFKKKKEIIFSDLFSADGGEFIGEELAGFNDSSEELLDTQMSVEQISQALKGLPGIYRMILVFYYFQQLNFREISEVLNEPLNTIKSRHRRAIIMIKKILNAPK